MVDESAPFMPMDLSGPEHMHPMAGMAAWLPGAGS